VAAESCWTNQGVSLPASGDKKLLAVNLFPGGDQKVFLQII
jgi:hypothetical protein